MVIVSIVKHVLDGSSAIYGIDNDYRIDKSMVECALEGKRVFNHMQEKYVIMLKEIGD